MLNLSSRNHNYLYKYNIRNMFSSICRVCLTGGVKMDHIEAIGLQEMYEKVTNNKLHTEDRRPKTICYLCRSQLQRCHSFYEKSRKAEKVLADVVNNSWQDIEKIAQTLNQKMMQNLSISGTKLVFLEGYETDGYTEYNSEAPLKKELDTFNDFAFDDIDTSGHIELSKEVTESNDHNVCNLSENIKESHEEYKCHTCGLTFIKKSQMEKHMKIHSENIYSCKRCDKKYPLGSDLKAHMMETHPKDPYYTCVKCYDIFSMKSDLNLHIKTHQKSYPCDCGMVFIRKVHLRKHMKSHTSANPKPYICKTCDRGFASKLCLKKHMRCHTVHISHTCTTCNKDYTTKAGLRTHNIRVHGNNKHACPECDRKFTCKAYVKRHMEMHKGKTYICHTCGMSFAQRKSLRQHTMTHNAVKTKICNVCSKAFLTGSQLRTHMKTHTGIKPFSCSKCSKSFLLKQVLTVHMRTHTGERPYICQPCNKSFTIKYNLEQHIMRLHTGIRPFVCDTCQKAFPTKSTLKIHIRTHTGEKPYVCKLCDRPFSCCNSLRRHCQLVHNGIKPFSCGMCDLKFTTNSSLKIHVKKHHGSKYLQCE